MLLHTESFNCQPSLRPVAISKKIIMLIYLCYKYTPLTYEHFIDMRGTTGREKSMAWSGSIPVPLDQGQITVIQVPFIYLHLQRKPLQTPGSMTFPGLFPPVQNVTLFILCKSTCRFLPETFKVTLHIQPFPVLHPAFQILLQKPKIVCQICM